MLTPRYAASMLYMLLDSTLLLPHGEQHVAFVYVSLQHGRGSIRDHV